MAEDDLEPASFDVLSDRLPVLRQAMSDLMSAPTLQAAADMLSAHGAALFEADAALIYLLDPHGENLELLAGSWSGVRPRSPWFRLQASAAEPLPRAVRTGQPVWVPSRSALLSTFPHLAGVEHVASDMEALIALPMRDSRRVIGGVLLGFDGAAEVAQLQQNSRLALVAICGLAIERSHTASVPPPP